MHRSRTPSNAQAGAKSIYEARLRAPESKSHKILRFFKRVYRVVNPKP